MPYAQIFNAALIDTFNSPIWLFITGIYVGSLIEKIRSKKQ